MKNTQDDWYKHILIRAEDITKRLKSARGIREMGLEISTPLRLRIFSGRKVYLAQAIEVNSSSTAPPLPLPEERMRLVAIDRGGLGGIHKLEDLIAELLAAYITPALRPKSKKGQWRPSFAFVLGALSALPRGNAAEDDFVRICNGAREVASELAVAAIEISNGLTLGEMQKGIEAVAGVDHKHDLFSRHVVAVLKACRNLADKGCSELLKGEIRAEASEILIKEGKPPFDDSAEWTKVYGATGLKHLKQERKGRRKSR
jgi:hypothetical protein